MQHPNLGETTWQVPTPEPTDAPTAPARAPQAETKRQAPSPDKVQGETREKVGC